MINVSITPLVNALYRTQVVGLLETAFGYVEAQGMYEDQPADYGK